jgi:hypothetical protein
MRDTDDGSDFDATVRRAWRQLVAVDLPRAAAGRGWPVTTPAGFERILLDHVVCAPFETVFGRGGADAAPLLDLILAVETGAQLIEGTASPSELNRRSLALRASRTGEPCAEPCGEIPAENDMTEAEVAALIARAIRAEADRRKR